MLFYTVFTILIIGAIVGILAIIIRKLPELASINIDSIASEQNIKARNKILLDRLKRKTIDASRMAGERLQPVSRMIKNKTQQLIEKAQEVERETLKKSQPLKKIDLNQEIREKLVEVERMASLEEFEKAEEMAISIITTDSENVDAYEHLIEIYREQKKYKEARETARYVLKLLQKAKKAKNPVYTDHRLANCYADLGYIYELEGRMNYALANIKKAVELQPHNPRFLDFLLKISIMLEDKGLAFEAFNALKETDPNNKKLPELEKQVIDLPS